ncbi:MAG: single-stranded DNA-binding protein [Clostridia bacterium]|nr:single-stranded DNA-binding protein [Clostridia bacterium]
MLNQITLMGRLTAAPDVRTTPSGISVTRFTLAVERDFKDRDGNKQTDFIDVVTWRSTADFVGRYVNKGQLVCVNGSLQTRSYEDREGNKRKAFEVVAENVYFCEKKEKNDTYTPPTAPEPSEPSDEDYTAVPDDDLPF